MTGKAGSLSSELIVCGGGVHSILLLLLLAICLETIDVCIWRMFDFMTVVVTVWGLWECLLCSGRCKNSVVFEPWSVEVCFVFV